MSKETGGPAFPVESADEFGTTGYQSGPYTWQFTGMTLRDYFAARAPMPPPHDFPRDFGRIETGELDCSGQPVERVVGEGETMAQYLARWSMHYADTMLSERLK